MPLSDDETQKLLHDLAQETLHRYREINVLYRAPETLASSVDPQEVPAVLLAEARQVIASDAAVVLLGKKQPDHGWASSAALIASVRRSGRPDYTDTSMCVPIRAGEKALGVVVLWREVGRPSFSAGDQKLLLALATQAGLALERGQFVKQERRRLQLEQELTLARQIQLTLVPRRPPQVPGWSFAASYHAAREVGGDFYDFMDHAISKGRLALAIGDVTGKGIPAALMMAYSRAVLRAESMAGREPVAVLENSNRLIMEERDSGLFVSALYAEIELASGRLTYASAGHDAPLWIRARGSEVRELEAPGVVLGAFQDTGLESRAVDLEPGDTVVLYTDGVTEARNDGRELFGDERLHAVAARAAAAGGSAEAVLDYVLVSIAEFCGDAEQADDLTIVVVRREGGA